VATAATATYREQYRREHIPPHYQGWLHLVFTFGIGGTALAWSVLQVEQVRAAEWLTIRSRSCTRTSPGTGPPRAMHHLKRGLRLVYERHTRQASPLLHGRRHGTRRAA